MWNKRPFNSPGANPFGNPASNNSEEKLSADSSKCPSCGSNIIYEPELASMICRNCGNVYSADTLEPRGSLGISKEHDYMGDSEISDDDKKRHEIVCNSCGAALVADENTMSTMCPFCGSPALITRRMTREFKPDYIVPFKIDKDNAKDIITKWISSRKHTPMGFKSKSRLTKMTALYVPFWLLDCGVNSDLSGTGKIINGLETTIYEVNATITYYVKGVPFDASLKIANKLMEAAEPFDYSEMVKFDNKYLQGFYAEKYDQLPTDMTERIMKRIEKFSRSETSLISNKYSEYEERSEKGLTWLSEISVKYCLLPIWFMTVEYDGKQYQFAVNGQTGEACGQVPTSSSSDLWDRLLFRSGDIVKWVLFALFIVAMGSLVLISGDIADSTTKTNAVYIFSFSTLCLLIIFVAVIIMKNLGDRKLRGDRKTAYEINDYDKDPGMDCYYDSTRHSDLKVNETMLRHVVKITDENGNVIGEHSVEL